MVAPVRSGASSRASGVAVLPVLYMASLLSFIDRTVFSLALQPIKLQFGFSDSQLGLLAGLAFGVSYAAFSPVAGWMADRRSRKIVLMLAIIAWSGATLATAFAASFATMFAARALVGVGEAAVMPLAVSMLSDTRAPMQRSRAFGLFLSASALGTVLGMLFGGVVIAAITRLGGMSLPGLGRLLPWQSLFAAAASLGLLFVGVVAIVLREPPRITVHSGPKQGTDGVWSFVVENPAIVLTLYIGLSLVQMATITNLIWIVPAMARAHGLASASAALMIGSSGGIAMTIGSFGAGWAIARTRARGELAAPLIACLISACAFACFTAIGVCVRSLPLALVLVTLGMFFSYTPTVAAFAVMGEALPASARARLAGFNTMFNAILCNSLGSLLVGVLGDRLFSGSTALAHALACVIGIGLVTGGGMLLLGLPAYRRRMRHLQREGAA